MDFIITVATALIVYIVFCYAVAFSVKLTGRIFSFLSGLQPNYSTTRSDIIANSVIVAGVGLYFFLAQVNPAFIAIGIIIGLLLPKRK